MSRPFEARHGGECGACGERFSPGTPIRYTDDDQLVHADRCPDLESTDLDLRPGETPCPACNLIHSGECW